MSRVTRVTKVTRMTKLTLYNQVMVFYVPRVIFHSGGAWSDSGDVVLTREMRISRVENQTRPKICVDPHVMRNLKKNKGWSITPMLLSVLRVVNHRFHISWVIEPNLRRKICDYPHVMRELLSDFNTSVLKEDITPMLLSALRLDNRRFRISRVIEPY